MTYAFSNLHLMNAGLRLLNEDEDRTQKRQNFEFLVNMDTGNGLTQAEFVLAILEQQGVVDRERDVMPWVEVGSGRVVLVLSVSLKSSWC